MSGHFSSYGGGIHHSAIIGGQPESREWRPEHGDAGVELGEAVRIHAFCTVDAGLREPTRVGDRSWLLAHTHVGHDAQIGEDCELSTGTIVGGHVVIGDGVKVGVNACFRPFVRVGDGARIGCGAVVVRDVPAGEVWAGNPAKCIKRATNEVTYERASDLLRSREAVTVRRSGAEWHGKVVGIFTDPALTLEADDGTRRTIVMAGATATVDA